MEQEINIDPPFEYYKSINHLPLKKFIDAVVNDNVWALVTKGLPPIEELQQAWANICIQYAEAMGDNGQKYYFNLLKEVAMLNATFRAIDAAIPVLMIAEDKGIYMPQFYENLNKDLHTDFVFRENDPENNKKNLRRMKNRVKGVKLQHDLKALELEKIESKAKGDKPTADYYQSILISLSDYAGYRLTDDISTYEFCERMRRVNKYIDQLKNKQNGGK